MPVSEVKYIYQLPYHERKVLCVILDQRDSWEELGGEHMKFDMITIQMLRRETLCGRSPTDALLWHWSQQNHTVVELFVLLSRMQHYQAMVVLKPFVDTQYHRLIYEGEENLGLLSSRSEAERSVSTRSPQVMGSSVSSGLSEARGGPPSTDKNLRIDSRNINVSTAHVSMPSKVVLPPRPERKILNTQQQPHREEIPESQPALSRKGSTGSDVLDNCSTIPLVEYEELERATSGWTKNAILGKGGFGTVFMGIWNNTAVAVKRLEQRERAGDSREQDQLLLRELSFPNSCRHDNVLPIYGVCLSGPAPCLVYQFMPNGSVEDRLLCRGQTPPLSWVHRLKIAEGTALGLQFLHTRPTPVIHGDIKSANILLGAEFEPRIADFGLAREGPRTDYTHMMVSRVHGTRPYLPEEFLRSRQLSVKVDTYSFGVVLFELATGLRAYQENRKHKYLKELVESVDETELGQLVDRSPPDDDYGVFMGLAMLGRRCVARLPRQRPDMVGVLQAVRQLNANTQPLRIQGQLYAASSLAALHEFVTHPKRESSPQPPSVPVFPHQSVASIPGGFPVNLQCPGVPQLHVHPEVEEEEEEHAPTSQGPQDGGVMPRFSMLLSVNKDSKDVTCDSEPSLANLRLGVDCCAPVDCAPSNKTVDLE